VDILVKSLEKEKQDNLKKQLTKELNTKAGNNWNDEDDMDMDGEEDLEENNADKKEADGYNYLEDEEEIRIGGADCSAPYSETVLEKEEGEDGQTNANESKIPSLVGAKRTNEQREVPGDEPFAVAAEIEKEEGNEQVDDEEEEEFPEEDMDFSNVNLVVDQLCQKPVIIAKKF